MRRSNFHDEPVDYAAVGATQAADLMSYPPEGFWPFEQSLRIGSGDERFAQASAALLTWTVQKTAGVTVSELNAGTGSQYGGIRYSETGEALEPVSVASEQRFSPDGVPYITAGTTAHLVGALSGVHLDQRVRVVYAIDEPDRVAFAYGTVSGHRVSGEEAFVVEHRADDSVWFSVRSLSQPMVWYYRLIPVLARRDRQKMSTAYLRALSPLWSNEK